MSLRVITSEEFNELTTNVKYLHTWIRKYVDTPFSHILYLAMDNLFEIEGNGADVINNFLFHLQE